MLSYRTVFGHDIRWLPVKNVGVDDAPAFAVLEVTGYHADGYLTVQKVSSTGEGGQDLILFNGITPIPVDTFGEATTDLPAISLSTGGNIPVSGSWGLGTLLHVGFYSSSGFSLSNTLDSTYGLPTAPGGLNYYMLHGGSYWYAFHSIHVGN